jgi:hypothetical protein
LRRRNSATASSWSKMSPIDIKAKPALITYVHRITFIIIYNANR